MLQELKKHAESAVNRLSRKSAAIVPEILLSKEQRIHRATANALGKLRQTAAQHQQLLKSTGKTKAPAVATALAEQREFLHRSQIQIAEAFRAFKKSQFAAATSERASRTEAIRVRAEEAVVHVMNFDCQKYFALQGTLPRVFVDIHDSAASRFNPTEWLTVTEAEIGASQLQTPILRVLESAESIRLLQREAPQASVAASAATYKIARNPFVGSWLTMCPSTDEQFVEAMLQSAAISPRFQAASYRIGLNKLQKRLTELLRTRIDAAQLRAFSRQHLQPARYTAEECRLFLLKAQLVRLLVCLPNLAAHVDQERVQASPQGIPSSVLTSAVGDYFASPEAKTLVVLILSSSSRQHLSNLTKLLADFPSYSTDFLIRVSTHPTTLTTTEDTTLRQNTATQAYVS